MCSCQGNFHMTSDERRLREFCKNNVYIPQGCEDHYNTEDDCCLCSSDLSFRAILAALDIPALERPDGGLKGDRDAMISAMCRAIWPEEKT